MRTKVQLLFMLCAQALYANNIQVSGGSLVDIDLASSTAGVQFSVSWENGWRTGSAPGNWDAAWLFVKFRRADTGVWQHARLAGDAQHSAPAGSVLSTGLLTPGAAFDPTVNYGVGAFLHRSENGVGAFTANDVVLRWNYGQNSIGFGDIAEVKVFAVEMVYVPQGSFWVGDGGAGPGTGVAPAGRFIAGGTTNSPFLITTEGAIDVANTTGALWGMSTTGNSTIGAVGTLPAAFPKGFQAFYCMKYEVSQQQWVDFLNTLTRSQQNGQTASNLSPGVVSVTNRYVMSNSSTVLARNGIRCDAAIDAELPIEFYCDLNGDGVGGGGSDGQWVACNYLIWSQLASFMDWSGLRPMTELEFEKACRGAIAPVAHEFAWGSAGVRSWNYNGTALGTNSEGVSNPETGSNGNAIHSGALLISGLQAPGRVGLFAGPATTRIRSGASYYGAMELSGNMPERAVTVGRAAGRLFNGTHGDGNLSSWPISWPAGAGEGIGMRGGNYPNSASFMMVSDRFSAALIGGGVSSFGGRGVRTAP
jgi:formylglycine-generating enzyme required for sulfatase activity